MRFFRETYLVLKREFFIIMRTNNLRMIVFVAPFLYAILLFYVYAKHTLYDMPIAVFIQDDSQAARTLTRMLEASPKLQIKYYTQNVEEIKDLMYANKIDAAVIIPSDFSLHLKRGKDIAITSYVNAATMISANMASSAINSVVQTFSAGVEIKTLMKNGATSKAAYEKFMPVKLDLRPMFNPSFNYTNFLYPGILATILQQVILLAMAISFTKEREEGSLTELFKISKSPLVLLIGKGLPYILFNFLIMEAFWRLLFPIGDVPMQGNWLLMITFSMLFITAVVYWGMWFSCIFKTQIAATQALMFIAMPSFILSGFTWPLSGMPESLQIFSQFIPITHFVSGFRNIYLVGVSFEYLLQNYLILGGILVANIAISYAAIEFLIKKQEVPTIN